MVAQNSAGAEFMLDPPEVAPRAGPCSLCLQPIGTGLGLFTGLSDKNIACILALQAEV